LQINIEKKHLGYFCLFLVLVGSLVVLATVPNPGHSLSEIENWETICTEARVADPSDVCYDDVGEGGGDPVPNSPHTCPPMNVPVFLESLNEIGILTRGSALDCDIYPNGVRIFYPEVNSFGFSGQGIKYNQCDNYCKELGFHHGDVECDQSVPNQNTVWYDTGRGIWASESGSKCQGCTCYGFTLL
jgi:hypothetical protein